MKTGENVQKQTKTYENGRKRMKAKKTCITKKHLLEKKTKERRKSDLETKH